MEWEPSPVPARSGRAPPPGLEDDDVDAQWGTPTKNDKRDWDTFATNRQRMFPNQGVRDETGLESLIAGWGLGGGEPTTSANGRASSSSSLTPAGPPTPMIVASTVIRIVSALLAVARLVAIALVLLQRIPHTEAETIDTIMSSVEIGVIVMSFVLPPRRSGSPRLAFLAIELAVRYIYLMGRHGKWHSSTFTYALSKSWTLGFTWARWAVLNATRAML